jgi:hypothetical protein
MTRIFATFLISFRRNKNGIGKTEPKPTKHLRPWTPAFKGYVSEKILYNGPLVLSEEMKDAVMCSFSSSIDDQNIAKKIGKQDCFRLLFDTVPDEAMESAKAVIRNEWRHLTEDPDFSASTVSRVEQTQIIANLIAIESTTGLHRFALVLFFVIRFLLTYLIGFVFVELTPELALSYLNHRWKLTWTFIWKRSKARSS